MSIQVNTHCRLNWTLEDLNGKVALETTETLRRDIDGINICVADGAGGKATTWMSVEEAQKLRDWLNITLPA